MAQLALEEEEIKSSLRTLNEGWLANAIEYLKLQAKVVKISHYQGLLDQEQKAAENASNEEKA